jgi:hypothetical protein
MYILKAPLPGDSYSSTAPESKNQPRFGWAVIPLALVACFALIETVVATCIRLRVPFPLDPWEAGIVTDAWRMLQGDLVYSTATDHATHAYGPLLTVSMAEIFRFTGPVIQVGRYVSAICGTLLVLLVAKIFHGPRRGLMFALSAALLVSANSRTQNYFTSTRPDLSAFLLATVALLVLYKGLETGERAPQFKLLLLGSLLFIAASLFKQTAAAFSCIPLVATLGEGAASQRRSRLVGAVMPPLSILITFGMVWRFDPALWHFMVVLLAQYKIPLGRELRIGVDLLLSVPLFLMALMHWISADMATNWRTPRARWLLGAIACTVPVSIVALAKDGGAPNSLMPALFAMGAFCVWRAHAAFSFLGATSRPLAVRMMMGSLLALVMFVQIYPDPRELIPASFSGGHGVVDRALVIAESRSLPGRIVCPDDPTIPLIAKGYAGRTAVFEADATYWNFDHSQALTREIRSADYVITMTHGITRDGRALVATAVGLGLTEDLLRVNGFEKSAFKTTATPVYVLWRRVRPRAEVSSRL